MLAVNGSVVGAHSGNFRLSVVEIGQSTHRSSMPERRKIQAAASSASWSVWRGTLAKLYTRTVSCASGLDCSAPQQARDAKTTKRDTDMRCILRRGGRRTYALESLSCGIPVGLPNGFTGRDLHLHSPHWAQGVSLRKAKCYSDHNLLCRPNTPITLFGSEFSKSIC